MTVPIYIIGCLLLVVIAVAGTGITRAVKAWRRKRKMKQLRNNLTNPDPNIRLAAYKEVDSPEQLLPLAVAEMIDAAQNYGPSRKIRASQIDFIVDALALNDPDESIRLKAAQHLSEIGSDSFPTATKKPPSQG